MADYTIGIDFGGTNLRVATYSEARGILERIEQPTVFAGGPPTVIEMIRVAVKHLRESRRDDQLVGIGMGTPGPLELPAGVLHGPPNLPGWDGFDLRSALRDALGTEVEVASDANLGGLAEARLGAGKTHGEDSLCMLSLGTGVGAAVILDGILWGGTHGMAGEPGHASVWPDGPKCVCGNRGCLELYASATALRRMAGERIAQGGAHGLAALKQRKPFFASDDLCALADNGDADARAIFVKLGEALGISLSGLVNMLDLPLYLVGGGVAGAWHLFSPRMFQEVTDRSYVYRLVNSRLGPRKIRIAPAGLGSDAGLLGAALLPLTMGSLRSDFALRMD